MNIHRTSKRSVRLPYIRQRGGPPGFLPVLSPTTLAFADYRGDRQFLQAGYVAVNDRVALFLMVDLQRTCLKLLGHARVKDARTRLDFVEQFASLELRQVVERLFLTEVVAFDWSCQKFITPPYTPAEFKRSGG